MLNVSDLISDPDFTQAVTVRRSQGRFQLGGFVSTATEVSIAAVVSPASEQDLEQVPQGDRITGAMKFYTADPLYLTRAGNAPGLSDVLVWRGEAYRLVKIWPYDDYGYTKAVGVRTGGA